MGKKINTTQPKNKTNQQIKNTKPDKPPTKPKHDKRVVTKEDEKEPSSKIPMNPQNTTQPLKSALKKDVKEPTPLPKKEVKKVIQNDKKEKSKDDTSILEQSDMLPLHGFSEEEDEDDSDSDTSDDDSSGDDNEFNQSSAFNSKDLPPGKFATKKTNDHSSKQQKEEAKSGVIYLGRIPHGFYEEEMRGYFSQFGEVVRLRLSRSKKTGRPKHYGFIEFKHYQVAQIVAETLHNYLLCGNLLQCKLLDQDQIHSQLWVGSGSKFRKDVKSRLRREKRNRPKTLEQQEVISNRLIEREKKKRKRLAELGIDYDFTGYVNSPGSHEQQSIIKNQKNQKIKKKSKLSDNSNFTYIKNKIQAEKSKKSIS